jgi:hypothetical protein
VLGGGMAFASRLCHPGRTSVPDPQPWGAAKTVFEASNTNAARVENIWNIII